MSARSKMEDGSREGGGCQAADRRHKAGSLHMAAAGRLLLSAVMLIPVGAVFCMTATQCTVRGHAQTRPQTRPTTGQSEVDEWLDRLDERGKTLRSFTAELELTETDNSTMLSTMRLGNIVFERAGQGDARMRIVFDTKRVSEDRAAIKEKIEYVLKDGWLIERDYRLRKQINRQVVRPGEKINLLKLGEGPFPLPIGQSRQEVRQQFEVKIVPPQKDDPPGAGVHLELTPRAGSQFERKFSSIDVWVDGKTDMPLRIAAVDRNATTTRTTDLKDMKVNVALGASAFDLPPLPQGWEKYEEPYGG